LPSSPTFALVLISFVALAFLARISASVAIARPLPFSPARATRDEDETTFLLVEAVAAVFLCGEESGREGSLVIAGGCHDEAEFAVVEGREELGARLVSGVNAVDDEGTADEGESVSAEAVVDAAPGPAGDLT
jgi:hypothetical protein